MALPQSSEVRPRLFPRERAAANFAPIRDYSADRAPTLVAIALRVGACRETPASSPRAEGMAGETRLYDVRAASQADVPALAALELECWRTLQPLSAGAIAARLATFGAGQLALFERSPADDGPGRLVGSVWSIRLDDLEQLTRGSARDVRHSSVLALHSPTGGTWLVVSTQASVVALCSSAVLRRARMRDHTRARHPRAGWPSA